MADRGNITTTVHATSDAKPDQFADPLDPTSEELAALPHDNAGPKLNAVIWMLTALSGVFLILRIYCRASRRRSLWWDDGFLVAARVGGTHAGHGVYMSSSCCHFQLSMVAANT